MENMIIDERGVKTCIENTIIHEMGKTKQEKDSRESLSGQQSMIQQRAEKYKVQLFKHSRRQKYKTTLLVFVAHNVLPTTPGRKE